MSSPTLAQGLNLGATTVIVYSLYRNRNPIDASEFRNVVGRAGRAFADIHGLVLHPVFDRHADRVGQWRKLVADVSARNLKSGLVQLVFSLLRRMARGLNTQQIKELSEYVLNNARVWDCPVVPSETIEESENEQQTWSKNIQMLDTALLSLLGSDNISGNDIPEVLDTILQSSLWQRCLNRRQDSEHTLYLSILRQRANFIWNATTPLQRRGYFLAGVGLETGLQLDEIADTAKGLLINANNYIANREDKLAIQTIIQLAEIVFAIPAFVPSNLPDNWRDIVTAWLNGEIFTEGNFADVEDTLQFVEDGLVYRLTWGLEAIRVRIQADEAADVNETVDIFEDFRVGTYELGLVIPALEFGTLSRSASLLMQNGFSSRKAALIAVGSTEADFSNRTQLREWLQSETTLNLSAQDDWPTPEASSMWQDFVKECQENSNTTWRVTTKYLPVIWLQEYHPVSGSQVRIMNSDNGVTEVLASTGEKAGLLSARYELLDTGIYNAVIARDTDFLVVEFCGSGDNPFEELYA